MADRELNFIVKGKDEASGPFGKVKKSLDEMSTSSGGLKGKLSSLGGGLVHFGKIAGALAVGALAGLAAGLGFAAKQAIEEEANLAKLNTTLAANIPNWDGNTAAIEALIDKRQNLAFSDDQLRDSLGTLVTFTKDLTKAQDLQALAMDFARLKGIDLTTASEILGKVSTGNTGILGRYGIAVGKNATATEALAAVQKAAAGQAEAYGNTTKGAFEKFQIAMNNVVEDVGAALLPIMGALATTLNDTVIPIVKDIAAKIGAWFKENKALIDQVVKLAGEVLGALIAAIGFVIGKIGEFVSAIANNRDAMAVLGTIADVIATAFRLVRDAIVFVIKSISDWVAGIQKNKPLMEALATVADIIGTGFRLAGDAVGWLLGKLGELATWVHNNLDTLRNLASLLPFIGGAVTAGDIGASLEGRAHGGPVSAGRPYIVGERGPEMFTPATSGRIIPNSGGRSAGGTFNTYLTVSGASDPDQWAAKYVQSVARRLRREGLIA